jgi:hypothetical protein
LPSAPRTCRDNEIAAEVMGVRLSSYKTLAFAWPPERTQHQEGPAARNLREDPP